MSIFKLEAKNIRNELITLRRNLHQYPELGMQERETSRFIKEFLKAENIPFIETAKTGVCGIIKGTKGDDLNRCIALRADIDGLPLEDKKVCDYSSKINGRMHACGHDAHTAILLGAAKLLNKHKNLFSGTVKLLFEPAEETVGGSRFMINEGVLDSPYVEKICGLHVEESIENGTVMVRRGVVNAASNPFSITIKGAGAHGAYPHKSIDPIVVASEVVLAIQNIISREVDTSNPAIITIGSIHGGTAQNIIPEEVKLNGIIRTMEKEDRIFIKDRLVELVEGICKAFRASSEIEIEDSYPSLYNNDEMVDLFIEVASNILGKENVLEQKKSKMGVESFSYFANERPSVFYFLGTGNKEKGIIHPAHSNLFDIDEDALETGVSIQCELVLQYLTRS
ncbi:M20 metallopeptidase family protein [Clostridium sp.]|uniref:M20 metallopeptidase family protein n=1 Tax=Clostridium sp. TaxID=1506 RepID=UPI003F3F3FBD